MTDTSTLPRPSVTTIGQDDPPSDAGFADLGLPARLLSTITRQGFVRPTAIQAAAIPALLGGEDVVGVAQTGTGKTAAFGLPLLARVAPGERRPQGVVLTPTRELAIQVAGAIQGFAADLPQVRVATIYGGAPFYPQQKALEAGAQVVVGTPGRIIDHLERGTLDLGGVTFVVLDEGDELLRMGFAEEVDRILAAAPAQRQTALFSATMPPAIRQVAQAHLRDPRRIAVTPQSSTVAGVDQRFAVVPFKHKIGALVRVLATSDAQAALVFVRTKAAAQEVNAALVERDVSASVISGDVSQVEREKTVERLRSGRLDVLVATDVAARGLDVERVGLVVNFDLPAEPEAYVHRIGRTGRAGRSGVAISFVTPREQGRVGRIQKATRAELVEMSIPTPAEVAAHRVAELLGKVPGRLAGGRLQIARQAVDEYLDARQPQSGRRRRGDWAKADVGGDLDATDARLRQAVELATALAALAVGDHGPAVAGDDEGAEPVLAVEARRGERSSRDLASGPVERSPYRTRSKPSGTVHRQTGRRRPADDRRSGGRGGPASDHRGDRSRGRPAHDARDRRDLGNRNAGRRKNRG